MNVEEIVKKYLKENGYDGLFNEDGECGCESNDMFPCEYFDGYCKPGYKVLGCPPECGQGCKFHIMAEKLAQGELPFFEAVKLIDEVLEEANKFEEKDDLTLFGSVFKDEENKK